jgi:hypothetical protein
MFKRRVLKKKPVSIFPRSLQCFALSAVNRVGKCFDGNTIPSLQRDSPRMGVTSLVINANNVAGRSHAEEPYCLNKSMIPETVWCSRVTGQ